MLTVFQKGTAVARCTKILHNDCFRQLIVDIVSAILDGNGAAVTATGHNGDGLTGIAAQRKQESIELIVIGFDGFYDVFLPYFRHCQVHCITRFVTTFFS